MNQTCRVCGEPAAGFHFGAFTCEGCKSFFGRSYNNLGSISECKNNGKCIINKKNRTACKSCRLKKCLLVGMSKSGSRYGRRSNWFKIHCLLQEQQQQQQHQHGGGVLSPPMHHMNSTQHSPTAPPPHHQPPLGLSLLGQPFPPTLLPVPKSKEELLLLGLDDYKNIASPSVSSPESHNSDSSIEVNDVRKMPLFPNLRLPPSLLHPHGFLFPPGYPPLYPPGLLQSVTNNNTTIKNNNTTNGNTIITNNNNNGLIPNYNPGMDMFSKQLYLDALLRTHPRLPTPDEQTDLKTSSSESPIQDDPLDLSVKATISDRGSSPENSIKNGSILKSHSDTDESDECDTMSLERLRIIRPTPLDLTTKI